MRERALRGEQGVGVDPVRAQEQWRVGERAAPEADQALAVEPGEVALAYGAGWVSGRCSSERRWCSASATGEFASAFESARR